MYVQFSLGSVSANQKKTKDCAGSWELLPFKKNEKNDHNLDLSSVTHAEMFANRIMFYSYYGKSCCNVPHYLT